MVRYFRKNFYLIIIMSLITFFSASTFYDMQEKNQIRSTPNDFLSDYSVYFNVNAENEVDCNNVFDNINYDYLFMKSAEGYNRSFYIYFNYDLSSNIPMVMGNFFESDDFNKNDNNIVIGKGYVNNIVPIDGVDYFFIDGEYKKVIGIIGDDKRETSYDLNIYMDIKSYFENEEHKISGDYIIDAGKNSDKVYEEFSEKLSELGIITTKSSKKFDNTTFDTASENLYNYKFLFKILIIFILDIFIVSNYWIKNSFKEIGIRRTLGATKLKVVKLIISKLFLNSILSFIIGNLVYLLMYYIQYGYIQFYIKASLIIFLLNVFVSILSSILPIVKSVKMQPQEVMR